MERRIRQRLRTGLVLAVGLVVAAWFVRRYGPTPRNREPEPITERHGVAFLVRRRLDPERIDDVRAAVSRRLSDRGWLLGVEEASTASLFIDWHDEVPHLVWYVEIPRTVVDGWADPDERIQRAFPVNHEAVRGSGDNGLADQSLLVHAVHPSRPRTVTVGGSESTGQCDGDGERLGSDAERHCGDSEQSVDVELVRMQLEPGLPERLADWFAGLSRRVIDGELELGPLESWSVKMLEAEAMYTESVFLERSDDGYVILGYMEAAAMERVYDAYYGTWNPVARLSEIVFEHLLVDPSVILEYPLETDVELLAHATNPNRPRRASECPRST